MTGRTFRMFPVLVAMVTVLGTAPLITGTAAAVSAATQNTAGHARPPGTALPKVPVMIGRGVRWPASTPMPAGSVSASWRRW